MRLGEVEAAAEAVTSAFAAEPLPFLFREEEVPFSGSFFPPPPPPPPPFTVVIFLLSLLHQALPTNFKTSSIATTGKEKRATRPHSLRVKGTIEKTLASGGT